MENKIIVFLLKQVVDELRDIKDILKNLKFEVEEKEVVDGDGF